MGARFLGVRWYIYVEGVSRISGTQHCATLSSTESECVALADVTHEAFLRNLLEFLESGHPQIRFVTMFEDNAGAVKIARSHVYVRSIST